MRNGNLFVISGPSGTGKGTLVAQILSKVPDTWLSISATTRAPRGSEQDGIDYYFVSREQFDDLVSNSNMLEWAEYSGNCYGTPRSAVVDHIAQGYQVILEIEVQGALQVKQNYPSACLIFIEPPSMEVLEQRLRGRGTDSEEAIQKRLQTARIELSLKKEYDYVLVNDHLDTAAQELVAFINEQADYNSGEFE